MGAEPTGNPAQNEISGCQNFTTTPGNMAISIDHQRQPDISVYQQQLLEIQRIVISVYDLILFSVAFEIHSVNVINIGSKYFAKCLSVGKSPKLSAENS